MKLVYTKWKDVKRFLAIIDQPTSTDFELVVRARWLLGHLVYDVEIPQEYIT